MYIDVQPVSLASFKTPVMTAAIQSAFITSQPFSDCRNSYTFLITLACSGFKAESRRATYEFIEKKVIERKCCDNKDC